jgi:Immunity protein 26
MELKYPKNFKVPEGTVVAIPVKPQGWVLGVYARVKKGRGLGVPFGYFFGDVCNAIPDASIIPTLRPSHAILQTCFGDIGLIEGRWPIIGKIEPWTRDDWPMPYMMISGAELGMPCDQRVLFDENDPSREIQRECAEPGTLNLPSASTPGSLALENILSMILGGERPARNTLRHEQLH